MQDLNKKIKKNLIISVIFFLICCSIYFSLLTYVKNTQNTELAKSMDNLGGMEEVQANYSIYNKTLNETEIEREMLNNLIINKESAADFIKGLENLADMAQVEMVKTVNVEKQTILKKENMLRFSLEVKGSLKDVFYLMYLVEKMPYKIIFRRMSLSSSESASTGGRLSVSSKSNQTTGAEKVTWTGDINFDLLGYINE